MDYHILCSKIMPSQRDIYMVHLCVVYLCSLPNYRGATSLYLVKISREIILSTRSVTRGGGNSPIVITPPPPLEKNVELIFNYSNISAIIKFDHNLGAVAPFKTTFHTSFSILYLQAISIIEHVQNCLAILLHP